ncbi:hypothetical protein HL667_15495 [Bradyrhizobium sp. 83012]|uniref:Uncharacterized protein n=1 Tax=Bradyrhizobium aeschynomenes TaxID=2734909 RepID=A0ABX2CDW4_9BRAD|nr:hypothetical protein [Bradyrhizobium aeschynomenes]NPU66406.1 hypothetical protein [Bradyrhizobium aeschynomenes]NPV20118.1 hypothetical protein [Bradyrhizobium aeschynomenes]
MIFVVGGCWYQQEYQQNGVLHLLAKKTEGASAAGTAHRVPVSKITSTGIEPGFDPKGPADFHLRNIKRLRAGLCHVHAKQVLKTQERATRIRDLPCVQMTTASQRARTPIKALWTMDCDDCRAATTARAGFCATGLTC